MMSMLILGQIPLILEELARGGGGGSGGSGGGSGAFFIGLAGYVPMHLLGAQLRKKFYHKEGWTPVRIAGWVIAGFIALVFIILVPISGSFFLAFYIYLPIAAGAILGMGAGLNAWFPKIGQSQKIRSALALAESKDPAWNEKNILTYAQGVFYKYQQDWSTFNTDSMKTYMTQNYQNHNLLMMYALRGAHRINKVDNPRILSSVIATLSDSDDNAQDTFEVYFTATANDQLFDDRTNALLFHDGNPFNEYWRFRRSGNNWLFDGIREATQNAALTRPDIAQFAQQNGMYYSADWGWLLLPVQGYIFNHGKFGVSDINNHVIGLVDNVLTQLYTYNPKPNTQSAMQSDQYLIVQTNVPKTYGQILVRRRSKFINWPVTGLTKVKMEWGEFNDMYDVYASDLERVTSFELLNPAFMANLRDLSFEVNIEVVDNVVYLFTKSQAHLDNYKALYDIVLKAHKEMQL